MSQLFRWVGSPLARRFEPSIRWAAVLSLGTVLLGCSGERGPDPDSDVTADETVQANREATTRREHDEGGPQNKAHATDDRFQLYLRVRTRIPTAGYACAFDLSLQNRGDETAELPEGTVVVFTVVRPDRPDDQPTIQTVSLEKSYRAAPDSFADLETLWITIPESGKLSVSCAIREPFAVASNPVPLQVEEHLFYDADEPRTIEKTDPSRPDLVPASPIE